MAVAVPIYSGSPPSASFVNPWSNPGSKPVSGDIDIVRRPAPLKKSGGGMKGGLSSLFASGNVKHLPDTHLSHSDLSEVSLPSAMASFSSMASFSCPAHLDGASLPLTCKDRADGRGSGAVNVPARSSFHSRDRSPVSVLSAYSSGRSSSPSPALVSTEGYTFSLLRAAAEGQGAPYRRRSPSLLEQSQVPVGVDYAVSRDRAGSVPGEGYLGYGTYRIGTDGDVAAYIPASRMLGDAARAKAKNGLCNTRSLPSGGQDLRESWKSLMDIVKQNGEYGLASGALLEDSPFFVALPSVNDDELLTKAQEQHGIFSKPLVVQAFRCAARAHEGQVRKSGEPYVTHCVDTALILAQSGSDEVVVAAGLLHDTLDDGMMSEQDLRDSFDDDLVLLVLGVSKLSKFSQLARDSPACMTAEDAGRLHTMFLAMADVRVVLIKLADRIHNLRTLDALPRAKQQRIAKETLEVFAPLANRLGIWSWKAEIEDVCFKFLHPVEHKELAAKLEGGQGKAGVMAAIEKLDKALKDAGVLFNDLSGRPKNLYSVYSKMERKGRQVDEIFDVRGIRLIVPDEASCYAARDVIRTLWQSSGSEHEKDYIQQPKANGYRSLHTVVRGDDGHNVEVQVRTEEMHHQAEFGLASHWRYKEGEAAPSAALVQKVDWARWVLTWQAELMDTKLRLIPASTKLRPPCPFPHHLEDCRFCMEGSHGPLLAESDCDPIYVIVMEDNVMVVQELPSGTTAGEILSRKENSRCSLGSITPVVNQAPVEDLSLRLRMGDLIELKAEPEEPADFWSEELLPIHAVAELEDWEALGGDGGMAVAFERERLKTWFVGEGKELSTSSSYL